MSDRIQSPDFSYCTKFQVGDRVKLNSKVERYGTVTRIANDVDPEDFSRMKVAYVEWDQKSIVITDGICYDGALILVERKQETLL